MFFTLQELQEDILAQTYRECMQDTNSNKVNLCVGIFADKHGKPFVFPSVQKASKEIDITNNDYYIIKGNQKFIENTGKLLYGETYDDSLFATQQTLGGTHAIALFAELLRKQGRRVVYLGLPTWTNHQGIFEDFDLRTFEHITGNAVNKKAYLKALEEAPENAVFVIHVGPTHNPTGVNITAEDIISWKNIINQKKICLMLDAAYLGFGNGLDEDIEEIRKIHKHIENYALAVSFSKNASLYKQKVGALFIKGSDKKSLESNIKRIVHRSVSNPPGYGVEVLNIVLTKYQKEWREELEFARQELQERRLNLAKELPEIFSFIKNGKGLFSILGLTEEQVLFLKNSSSIYFPKNSRISFGGIQEKDIKYISESIGKLKL